MDARDCAVPSAVHNLAFILSPRSVRYYVRNRFRRVAQPKVEYIMARILIGGLLLSVCWISSSFGEVVFTGEKRRNNLVSDLLEVDAISKSGNSFSFHRPQDGWIFVSATCKGKVAIRLAGEADKPPVELIAAEDSKEGQTVEAVRKIAQGDHRILVECDGTATVSKLIVRSIPELVHCGLNSSSIKSYGPFDLEFLKKDVLPNVTTLIVSAGIKLPQPVIDDWHRQGKKFLGEVSLNREGKTGDVNFEFYTKFLDAAPFLDGLIVNEFGMNRIARPPDEVRRERAAQRHRPYEEAFRKMRSDERYRDKPVYCYFGGSGNVVNYDETGMTFCRTLIDLKYPIALERYIYERPTEKGCTDAIQTFVDGIADWESKEPGAKENMLLTFGLFNAPPGGSNRVPNVDFHVYMDQQMNTVANHPTLSGLAGLNWWTSTQADEDSVRFVGKLYRHYAIEGKTELLTNDPLMLTHLQNADFEEGAMGWTIEAAEDGSVDTKSFPRYGRIEGRYPRDRDPVGDKFLWMKRNEKGPNRFSQTIKNLQPGRLYSMKMFSCDYGDMINPQKKELNEAPKFVGSVVLDGVEVDQKRSFQELYASNPEPKIPIWITYHWTIFRAKAPTARLAVSDWPAEKDPTIGFGQEQAFNFIEIQPYHE